MRKLHILLVLGFAVLLGLLGDSAVAVPVRLTPTDSVVPNALAMFYDPTDGHIFIEGNGLQITTLELKSAGNKFIPSGIPAGTISPPFDVATPAKIFKLSTGGFAFLDLGRAYPPGIPFDLVINDLTVDGSRLPSGNIAVNGGPHLCCVPEPSAFALLGIGALGLLGRRRK